MCAFFVKPLSGFHGPTGVAFAPDPVSPAGMVDTLHHATPQGVTPTPHSVSLQPSALSPAPFKFLPGEMKRRFGIFFPGKMGSWDDYSSWLVKLEQDASTFVTEHLGLVGEDATIRAKELVQQEIENFESLLPLKKRLPPVLRDSFILVPGGLSVKTDNFTKVKEAVWVPGFLMMRQLVTNGQWARIMMPENFESPVTWCDFSDVRNRVNSRLPTVRYIDGVLNGNDFFRAHRSEAEEILLASNAPVFATTRAEALEFIQQAQNCSGDDFCNFEFRLPTFDEHHWSGLDPQALSGYCSMRPDKDPKRELHVTHTNPSEDDRLIAERCEFMSRCMQSAGYGNDGSAATELEQSVGFRLVVTALSSDEPVSPVFDISRSRGIRLLLDPATGMGSSTELERLIHKLIPHYYRNLALVDRKRIQKALLALPRDIPAEDELFTILEASGPGIQKLFQLYGNKLNSGRLKSTLERLKDDLAPFSIEMHKARLEKQTGKSFLEMFPVFDPNPVGVGTVAQVHRGSFRTLSGKLVPVALKFRKLDYDAILNREFLLLEKIAEGDDFARQIVARLKAKTIAEGDFENEIKGIRKGSFYQMARSVQIAPDELPVLKDLFGMVWMEGDTFNRVKDKTRKDLLARYKELSAVYAEWLKRAFLGDHFFHGDPHGGNLSFDGSLNRKKIGYLDFGHWDELQKDAVVPFANLARSVAIKSPELAIQALQNLQAGGGGELSRDQKNSIRVEFDRAVTGEATLVERMSNLFAIAARIGIQIPGASVSFQRGMMLFDFEFKSILTELQSDRHFTSDEKRTISFYGSDAVNFQIIASVLGRQTVMNAADALGEGLGILLFGNKRN